MERATTGTCTPDSDTTLYARIRSKSGLVTQATVSSISYSIYDLTDQASQTTGTFTVSSVIFDSLQQDDPRWTTDSAERPGTDGSYGYNFRATISAGDFSDVDTYSKTGDPKPHQYQVDVKFTLADGQVLVHVWKLNQIVTYV